MSQLGTVFIATDIISAAILSCIWWILNRQEEEKEHKTLYRSILGGVVASGVFCVVGYAVCLAKAPFALLNQKDVEINSLAGKIVEKDKEIAQLKKSDFKKEDFFFSIDAEKIPTQPTNFLIRPTITGSNNNRKSIRTYFISIEIEKCDLKAADPFMHPNWQSKSRSGGMTFYSSEGYVNPINPGEGLTYFPMILNCPKYPKALKASIELSITDNPMLNYAVTIPIPEK
jgi:hypothetical protein